MFITLTDTFDYTVERAIKIAKENKLDVVFLRDGEHSTNDLAVVLAFHNAGFAYDIKSYKGKYENNAIKVVFHYVGK